MQIEELHNILFDIMCEIDDACKAENVSYMLGGGTMLGAVRHKDFIPWDDDADLCVWYQDYPAFRDALKKHLPEHLRLIEPEHLAPNFFDFIPRVVDTRYHWHEPTEEDQFYDNKQNYVCVDIFMVSNGADSVKDAKKIVFKQKITYFMALGHRYYGTRKGKNFFEKVAYQILRFSGRFTSMNKIMMKRKKLFEKYVNKPAKYCLIINDIPKYWKVFYQREWFEGVVYLPFRDRLFPVQKGYHEKLTLQYGDYMKPPKDKSEFQQHMKFD